MNKTFITKRLLKIINICSLHASEYHWDYITFNKQTYSLPHPNFYITRRNDYSMFALMSLCCFCARGSMPVQSAEMHRQRHRHGKR